MYGLQRFCNVNRIICSQIEQKWKLPQRIQQKNASHYQRPSISKLNELRLQELKTTLFRGLTEISNNDWELARSTLIKELKHVNSANVDTFMLGIFNEPDQLHYAKSYVDYLRSIGTIPNLATLGRLLKAYYSKYQASNTDTLSIEEQAEILKICSNIKSKHEILDATTSENLICGLVATESWSDAVQLLDMIKLTATPTVTAYSALIVKAFRVGNIEVGWKLLHDMAKHSKQPKCIIYKMYIESIAKETDEKVFLQKFELLLDFVGKHQFVITEEVCKSIEEVSKRFPHILKVSRTQLSRTGICHQCSKHLQNVSISDEEFEKLSDSFLNKVLIRKDVFQKSTPEEVERFKRYVAETGPYDCVIDGLNVAYSMGTRQPPRAMANLLADVLKYFKFKNKHVLILGRKHMNKWPKDTMSFIWKNASMFLTNDLTHDDPFMLYATIKSGQTTDFFSRDLMRTHAYLLGPELKSIFRRWQQEHQYALVTQTHNGKIIVKEPIRHLIHAHKVESTWHIPCKEEYSPNPEEVYEIPESWLCLEIQNK